MRGVYSLYDGTTKIGEFPNIITDQGKEILGKFLSRERASWADVIAVGAAEGSPLASNLSLGLEFWREQIDLKRYSNGSVIVRATIPVNTSGKIYELGIYAAQSSESISEKSSVIRSFDTSTEEWVGGTLELNFQRVGTSAIKASASSIGESIYSPFIGNLRSYTTDSVFKIGYVRESSGVTEVLIRFKADDDNYREVSFSPIGGGYQVYQWQLSDFSVVGNPDWSEIYEIEIISVGSGNIIYDAIISRQTRPGEVLVSRSLISSSYALDFIEKNSLRELQIEYSLDLGI